MKNRRIHAIFVGAMLLSGCVFNAPPVFDPVRLSRSRELIDQGTAALRSGDLRSARAAFQMADEVDPSAASLDGLGCVALADGLFERAEEFFVRAIRVDPNYGPAFANLALLYERAGLLEEARGLYRRALEIDPQNVAARNNYAALLADNARDAKDDDRKYLLRLASEEFRKAEALVPHPIVVHNRKDVEER